MISCRVFSATLAEIEGALLSTSRKESISLGSCFEVFLGVVAEARAGLCGLCSFGRLSKDFRFDFVAEGVDGAALEANIGSDLAGVEI